MTTPMSWFQRFLKGLYYIASRLKKMEHNIFYYQLNTSKWNYYWTFEHLKSISFAVVYIWEQIIWDKLNIVKMVYSVSEPLHTSNMKSNSPQLLSLKTIYYVHMRTYLRKKLCKLSVMFLKFHYSYAKDKIGKFESPLWNHIHMCNN